MKLPVLVHDSGASGWVATVGPPFNWQAAGETHGEAVRNLQAEVNRHLSNGARVDEIEVPDVHPALKWVGTWNPDDPVMKKWQECVEENRRLADEDPRDF